GFGVPRAACAPHCRLLRRSIRSATGIRRATSISQGQGARAPRFRRFERVVLWFEHDVTDQLSLIHLLGHYATHRRPSRLELVSISDFPGARRFTGLGELPPEALR